MTEREMNMHQRGMVDNCFEEGHYVRGIATLNQLRMERLRPSPDHIRQLIYISLYPPPPQMAGGAKGKRRETSSARVSPSKEIQQAKRLQRQALIPPPEATEAAKELLHQFTLDSISPESLTRALPCYPLSPAELDDAPRPIRVDILAGHNEVSYEKDAEIAKEAARLKEHRDCWSMLREGVVTRRDAALTRMEDPFLNSDALEDKAGEDPTSTVVGKYSWYLLDWFVRLFEKDQRFAEEQNDGSYSILLLSQIMPVSTGNASRSYVESIVEIIFLCYNQTEQWRKILGKRMMSLLISLTRCNHFSPLQLFKTISIRLQASPNSLVTEFLSDLPMSAVSLRVTLAVCDRFLAHALQSSPAASADGIARARPQARKARPASIHTNGDSECPSRQISTDQEYQAKWGLPSSQRILRLLDPDSKEPSATRGRLKNFTALFHVIIAFGTLQAKEGKNTDGLWADAVRSGDLERRICCAYADKGLPEDEARTIRALRLILIGQCTGWERLIG